MKSHLLFGTRVGIGCALLVTACANPAAPPPRAGAGDAPPTAAPATSLARFLRETPDAPFRATAPVIAPPAPFALPPIRSFRLTNGVNVLFLEQHSPALLRVEIVVKTGATAPAAELMAARAVWLASAGYPNGVAAARDAELASSWSSAFWGVMTTGVSVLSDRAEAGLALLADVTTHPKFPADGVLRDDVNEMHAREATDDVPGAVAERVLPMALYGWARPKDSPGLLSAADIGALTRADVVRAYDEAFEPKGTALLVVGDTTEEALRPMLEHAFGSWKSGAKHAPPAKVAPAPLVQGSPRIVVIDRPRSPESYVVFGGPGPSYGSEDWAPAVFMDNAFHRAGTREPQGERRITGNPYLELVASPLAPRVVWRGELPVQRTVEGLRDIDRAMRAAKDSEVSPDEIEDIRLQLKRTSADWLTTLEQESGTLRGIVLQGLSLDAPSKAAARFEQVTAADVHRVAAIYLDPDRMKIVIVGDWSSLRAPLLELGWGPIELRNVAGTVIGVEPGAGAGAK